MHTGLYAALARALESQAAASDAAQPHQREEEAVLQHTAQGAARGSAPRDSQAQEAQRVRGHACLHKYVHCFSYQCGFVTYTAQAWSLPSRRPLCCRPRCLTHNPSCRPTRRRPRRSCQCSSRRPRLRWPLRRPVHRPAQRAAGRAARASRAAGARARARAARRVAQYPNPAVHCTRRCTGRR